MCTASTLCPATQRQSCGESVHRRLDWPVWNVGQSPSVHLEEVTADEQRQSRRC